MDPHRVVTHVQRLPNVNPLFCGRAQSSRVITVPTEDPMTKYIEKLFSVQLRNSTPFAQFMLIPGEDERSQFLSYIDQVLTNITPANLRLDLNNFRSRVETQAGFEDFRNTWEALVSGRNNNSIIESFRREWDGLVILKDRNTALIINEAMISSLKGDYRTGNFGNLSMKVEPVERLRTVTALTGYTRGAIGDLGQRNPPETVPLNYTDNTGSEWYAAAEAFGEGLLITFEDDTNAIGGGARWDQWKQHHQDLIDDALGPREQIVPWLLFRSTAKALAMDDDWKPEAPVAGEYFAESHPLFVWWHTFAHHFIRAVQAETGYSSSAISERIYAVPDNDGKWKGAILLYVTEGGMDGTLGGLTSLFTHFQTFLDRVLDDAQVCSMDPFVRNHQIVC